MDLKNGSRNRGTRLAACSLLTSGILFAQVLSAETIFTVNGVDVDSAVVDLYFNSRLGNQGGQATPEQREILMAELRDIYILATQDNAAALAQDERIAAIAKQPSHNKHHDPRGDGQDGHPATGSGAW